MLDLMKFGTMFKQVSIALKDSNFERRAEAINILKLLFIYSEDPLSLFISHLKDLNQATISKINETLTPCRKQKTGISIFATSSFNPEESKLEDTPV